MLDDGKSCQVISEFLCLDDDTIRGWHTAYKQGGWDALSLWAGARFLEIASLMIAVKGLFQGNYSGGTGHNGMWMRKVGDGTETTVEQALMRGLDTA